MKVVNNSCIKGKIFYSALCGYLALPEEDVESDELAVFLHKGLEGAFLEEIVGFLLQVQAAGIKT